MKLPLKIHNFNIKVTKLSFVVILFAVILVLLLFTRYYLITLNLPEVKVVTVKSQKFTAEINTRGILQCTKQQDFYAGASSLVKEIRKDEGSRVTIGEAILLLDNSNALRELGKAENNLAILENDYLQAVSNKVYLMNKRDEARKKLEQLEQLYELGQATLNDLEVAKAEVADLEKQIAEINLYTLENEVNKGRLAVQEARENLADTVITSPFEGTVLKMAVKRGEPVSKDDFLFSVGKTDTLEVVAYVQEYEAVKVRENQVVQVYNEAIKEKHYQGRVAYIAPLAEVQQTTSGPESRVKLTIALEEMSEELKPGYTVNVKILLDENPDALTIPKEAILERDGESIVFVYEDGLAKKRVVQKGLSNDDLQEITAGLQPGDEVIVNPQTDFPDSLKVKISNT